MNNITHIYIYAFTYIVGASISGHFEWQWAFPTCPGSVNQIDVPLNKKAFWQRSAETILSQNAESI